MDTDKYVEGIDQSKLPLHAGAVLIAIGQAGEGKSVTSTCPYCGSLIQVETKGNPPNVWIHSCACGKCNGSLRGL